MGLNVSPSSVTLKASPFNKRRRRLLYEDEHQQHVGSGDETDHTHETDVNDEDDGSLSSPPTAKRLRHCHHQTTSHTAATTTKSVRFQSDDRLVEIKVIPCFLDVFDDNYDSGSDDSSSTSSSSPSSTCRASTKEEIEYIKSTLWWTRDEKRETIERNQLQSRALCQQRSLAVLSAQAVYQQICDEDDDYYRRCVLSSPCISASSSSEDEDESDDDNSDDDDDTADDSSDDSSQSTSSSSSILPEDQGDDQDEDEQIVQECHDQMRVTPLPALARGLEWGYLPASKAFRKTHVRSVLKWQRDLIKGSKKNKKRGGRSSSSAMRILQRRTRASSRRSRLMARVLAETDRMDCTADPNTPRSPPLALFPKPRLPSSSAVGRTATMAAATSKASTTTRQHHFVGRRLPLTRRPRMIPW
jgi:hypothetical protein